MTVRPLAWGALGLLSVAAVAASCSKKKSSESELSDGAAITISGQLAISSSSALALRASNLNPDDLQVYCVSFEIPPKAGTGDVDADGNFSLSIEANNVSIGCFVQKGEQTLATMVFEDTESKDVSGESKKDGRMAFSGNTQLGKISLDPATGKAVANITAIKNQLKRFEGSDGFNPDGTWKLRATDNVPVGYKTIDGNDERGPQEGMEVFMKRIDGKTVADGAPAYAIGIWKSEEAYDNCGKTLGFNNAEAKEAVEIDFSESGLKDGPFTWKTDWVDGWKYSDAAPNETVNYGRGPVNAGTKCSTLTDDLNKLRCYADYYFNNDEGDSSECIADINLNWAAETADNFVLKNDGPVRARTQYVMNLMSYTSPTTVSVNDSREYFRGVESGNEWVDCRYVESNQISMSKIDDNTMQMELIIESRTADEKAACSEANDEEGLMRYIFKAERK